MNLRQVLVEKKLMSVFMGWWEKISCDRLDDWQKATLFLVRNLPFIDLFININTRKKTGQKKLPKNEHARTGVKMLTVEGVV